MTPAVITSILAMKRVSREPPLLSLNGKMAEAFASAPTKTIGLIKQAVNFASTSTLEEAMNNEATLQNIAGKSADHTEGVAAFLEKRPAQFKGE